MKNAIKFLMALTACFLMSGIVWADDAEFRLVNTRNDMAVGQEFHVALQVRMTGTPPRTLASMTIDVYYNSTLTQWGDDPSAG
ncbi:MAG: hypothetical protein QUS35_02975 [bacterium]|nr:hypothetical protein [bacterium]